MSVKDTEYEAPSLAPGEVYWREGGLRRSQPSEYFAQKTGTAGPSNKSATAFLRKLGPMAPKCLDVVCSHYMYL